MKEARVSEEASDAALRSIPDRIPRPRLAKGSAERREALTGIRPTGRIFFSNPAVRRRECRTRRMIRCRRRENVGINAHIAAARRAAQAALLDSAGQDRGGIDVSLARRKSGTGQFAAANKRRSSSPLNVVPFCSASHFSRSSRPWRWLGCGAAAVRKRCRSRSFPLRLRARRRSRPPRGPAARPIRPRPST